MKRNSILQIKTFWKYAKEKNDNHFLNEKDLKLIISIIFIIDLSHFLINFGNLFHSATHLLPRSKAAPRGHFVKINDYPISMNIYRHKFEECLNDIGSEC